MALELIGEASGVHLSDFAKEINSIEHLAEFVSIEVDEYEIIDEDSLVVFTKATKADGTTEQVELGFTRSIFRHQVTVFFNHYHFPDSH